VTRPTWDHLLSELCGGSDDPDAPRLANEIEREVKAMTEWKDISTAPKDGTVIIGAAWRRRSDGGERIWRCWWQPEFDGWIESCRQMTMAPGYTIDGQTQKLPVEFIGLGFPIPAALTPKRTEEG